MRVKLATRTRGLRPHAQHWSQAAGTENGRQRARETQESQTETDASTGQRGSIQEKRDKSTSTRRSSDRFQHNGHHSVAMRRLSSPRRTRTRLGHQECHASRHDSRKCTKGPGQNTGELSIGPGLRVSFFLACSSSELSLAFVLGIILACAPVWMVMAKTHPSESHQCLLTVLSCLSVLWSTKQSPLLSTIRDLVLFFFIAKQCSSGSF